MAEYTEKEFAQKIDWEGGVIDALEYGLKSTDVEPGDLRDAWKTLQYWWDHLEGDLSVVQRMIDDLLDDE